MNPHISISGNKGYPRLERPFYFISFGKRTQLLHGNLSCGQANKVTTRSLPYVKWLNRPGHRIHLPRFKKH